MRDANKLPTPDGERFIMDNSKLVMVGAYDVTRNADDLLLALQWALNHHKSIVAWYERDSVLYLLWTAPASLRTLPLSSAELSAPTRQVNTMLAPIANAASLRALVIEWLERQPEKREIDDDGSDVDESSDAFEAWKNQWGHGGDEVYCALAIKKRTRWYGK